MRLADDYALLVGKRICAALAGAPGPSCSRPSLEFVEPQVQALLADLGSTLDPHGALGTVGTPA